MDGFPSSTAQNSFEGGSSEFTSTVPIFDGSFPVNFTSIRGLTRYKHGSQSHIRDHSSTC